MRQQTWLVLTIVIAASAVHTITAAPAARRPPNILLILADDLGWSDTTLFGTTRFYQTPNIERLARRGVTFSRAYSASPLCSPTRASIMTGLSPARIGITAPVCHIKEVRLKETVAAHAPAIDPALGCRSATRLETSYYTLAEALKAAGYATGHFGKWHLGAEPYDPLHQGFDVDIPHWPGPGPAGSYVAPWRFPNFKPRTPHEHIEDRMGDEAVAFMRRHKDEPFFINYWQFSVHAPFDAKPEYIEKNRRRVDPNDPQRSPTYAAMVESLDDNVGKMLDALDELDLLDRTIIIFYSDNGGNMYNVIDGTTPTSNAPLRGGKATVYEGGIRVPCIISWPGVTKPGSRCDQMIQSTDLYPTILAMLGRKPQSGQKFDGISITPALHGKHLDRDAIFTYFPHAPRVPDGLPPSVTVHQGDWKLIRIFFGRDGVRNAYQLYNLAEDIGEHNDLAAKYPERVRQLDARIDQFLRNTGAVLPKPNPNYDPAAFKLQKLGLSAMTDCKITIRTDRLKIHCVGGDPHFTLSLPDPQPAGQFLVTLRMQSKVNSPGHVYWQEKGVRPTYERKRRVGFQPIADGQFHTYQVRFATRHPLVSIRLDPIQATGHVVLGTVELRRATDNHLIHQWTWHERE